MDALKRHPQCEKVYMCLVFRKIRIFNIQDPSPIGLRIGLHKKNNNYNNNNNTNNNNKKKKKKNKAEHTKRVFAVFKRARNVSGTYATHAIRVGLTSGTC